MSEFNQVNQEPVPPPSSLREENSDISGDLQIEPRDVRFATQDPDEKIYVLTRQDVITNLAWALQAGIMAVLPAIFYVAIINFGINFGQITPVSYQGLALFLYYSVVFTYIIFKFNEWYFNVFIVTNKRILAFQFTPLNRYRVSEAELRNIQDVSEAVIGLFPSVFGYGNLFIQTAAEKEKFKIENVPKATWLRDVIVDLTRLSHRKKKDDI
jgi:membrane protein YdbS with pleckstrin-like domain